MKYIIEIDLEKMPKEQDGSQIELCDVLRSLGHLCLHVLPYEGTIWDSNAEIVGHAKIVES